MPDYEKTNKTPAPAPLFRDPVYDCPTDPAVVWNRSEKAWYLFYTQRRASGVNIGVSYVHGTKIGIASSKDGGKWLYRGTIEGLDIEPGHNTFWAPEIIYELGQYHMFVSYITGIPTDWEEPRQMLHYTSRDLWNWKFEGRIHLNSSKVIDACVYKTEPQVYKMWYKDEEHASKTYGAISSDLYHWEVLGEEIHDCAQEGPNVFKLGGKSWMISDYWKGLAVYRTEDFKNWTRCKDILNENGKRPMDCGFGHHADIVSTDEQAYIFYFCHPNAAEGRQKESDGSLSQMEKNQAVIQVAELKVEDNQIVCDRNAEVYLNLNNMV